MIHAIVALAGICLGVLYAEARTPRVRWLALTSTTVLTLTAALAIIWLEPGSLLDAMILVITLVVVQNLTAGYLWDREELDRSVSYWGWVWKDFVNPRFLRQQYRVPSPAKALAHREART